MLKTKQTQENNYLRHIFQRINLIIENELAKNMLQQIYVLVCHQVKHNAFCD